MANYILKELPEEMTDGKKVVWRTRIFPWLTSTGPHDSISKGKTSHPYILQTL